MTKEKSSSTYTYNIDRQLHSIYKKKKKTENNVSLDFYD
jgi:hypothetical protein